MYDSTVETLKKQKYLFMYNKNYSQSNKFVN